MKKFFFLIFILQFSCCQKTVPVLEMPKRENINDIINCVTLSDSLLWLNSFKIPGSTHQAEPISVELIKLQIVAPQKPDVNGVTHFPLGMSIEITDLLSKKVNNQTFFSSKDSIYLQFQNKNSKKIILDENINDKIKQIDLREKRTTKSSFENRYYTFTIPYFSLDKTKVYIEVTHYCPYMCSSADAFFLEKQNGKWKIISKQLLWIS
jgi:hypothetical protein